VAYRELNQVKLTLMDMRRKDHNHPPSCYTAVWKYLSSGWNLIDLAGILALYVAAVAHLIDSEVLLQHVGSLGVLLNAFSLLQLLTPFDSTGPLIKTVLEILNDISGYVALLLILLWGFSVSFAVAMPKNKAFMDANSGPLIGLLTSFEAIVGSFDMNNFENLESMVFFVLYLSVMVIIMLNLLIAIMSDSYEKVKESEVVEARKLRAETIIAEEKLMSDRDRANADYFPRYLQVLRATDGTEQKWSGLSGKMVSEILKVKKQLAQTERGLKQQAEQVSDKVDEKVEQVKEQVTQLKGQMEEMKEQVKEQVKGQMEEMKEQVKEQVTQLKGQMEEMKEQIHGMKTEIIDALKAELTQSRAMGRMPEQRPEPEPEPEVEGDV
jgi:methyl-accepting chemotaxis protein